MSKQLIHPKILEFKRRSRSIEYRAIEANADIALLDEGIVEGYAVIWGSRNMHREKFVKGAFARSIADHGPGSNSNYEIKFLNQHDPKDPLGLFEILEEDDRGLRFRTKKLDDVDSALRVLKQLKSRTLNNYSPGFNPDWNKAEWDDTDESVVYKEARLFELSVVSIPSELETYTVRSLDDLDDLDDETEMFLRSLPRKAQLEARNLFARHKSLRTTFQPTESNKPSGVDYNFLLNNL